MNIPHAKKIHVIVVFWSVDPASCTAKGFAQFHYTVFGGDGDGAAAGNLLYFNFKSIRLSKNPFVCSVVGAWGVGGMAVVK